MSPQRVLKTAELFAGAGGLSLGFLLANHPQVRFQPLFALDSDSYATETYRTNMQWLSQHAPHLLPQVPTVYQLSAEDLRAEHIFPEHRLQQGDLDLLIGGPPCQGLSSSNRQSQAHRRAQLNNLLRVFLEKVQEFRPKMFLVENVQGVRWTPPTEEMTAPPAQLSLFPDDQQQLDDVRTFIVRAAQQMGYNVWHNIIDAVHYGVPQHRHRFFLFGVQQDVMHGQSVNLTPYLEQKRYTTAVTVAQAINDLPVIANGASWEGDDYQASADEYVQWLRQYMNSELHDHFTTQHRQTSIDRFELIPEGGNWENVRHLMTSYKNLDNTHSNIYRRLVNSQPSHTISHYRKSMTIHPTQHRGISFREACRLQSFPDWFRFVGPRDHAQQQQLANAVPPRLAAAVAWAIGQWWDQQQLEHELPLAHGENTTLEHMGQPPVYNDLFAPILENW